MSDFGPVVDQVRVSQQSSPRTGSVIGFVWHHQASTDDDATIEMMVSGSRQVSATYTVDNADMGGRGWARVTGVVPEHLRPWTSASSPIDGRALTAEVCNLTGDPEWAIGAASTEACARLAGYAFLAYGVPLRRIAGPGDVQLGGHLRHDEINVFWPSQGYPTFCPGHLDLDAVLARAAELVAQHQLGPITPISTWKGDEPDMIIAQDEQDGRLFIISGNTKLEVPAGGGSDPYSPGKGNLYADLVCAMTGQPTLVALNHDLAMRIPNRSPEGA